MKFTDVDPSFAALPQFARITHGSTRQVDEMRRQHLYADGALQAKMKLLMALLWSVSSHCEPCIKYYARKSKEAGVSDVELGEALAVATTMGACVAETWALKAFAAAGGKSNEPNCAC